MRRLLLLILLFLACAGISSAAINVKSIEGDAGFQGYRAVNDSITINLTSSSDNLSIEGIPDNACTCTKKGLYYCSCQFSDSQDSATVSYSITDDLGDSANALMKVDDGIGNIVYSVQNNNGNATLTYSITDTGYNGNNACSGIADLEIYSGSDNPNSVDFNNSPGNCLAAGKVLLNVDSGDSEFYIIAKDNVGNEKESEHKNITIDVTAPEVGNVAIKSYGKDLLAIAQNAEIPVDISFDVTENHLSSIYADISSINNNAAIKPSYKKIIVPIAGCIMNDSSGDKIYSCTIKAKTLRTTASSVNISITANDTYGNADTSIFAESFKIDNTKPNAQITTDKCDSKGKCYVSNGVNKINIALDKMNFDNMKLFFTINGLTSQIINCTQSGCYGYITINCQSGNDVAAQISPQSTDDSGNKILSTPVSLKCDNNAPKFINVTFRGENNDAQFKDIIMSNSRVIINALIYDAESDELGNITAYLADMKNTTENPTGCVKDFSTNIFNCSWTILNINSGYYKTSITINISDIVGNTVSADYAVTVLSFKDNSTPDLLKLTFDKVVPTSINRISLDLANTNMLSYFVYAQYHINAKGNAKDVVLLMQKPNDCIFKNLDTDKPFDASMFASVGIADPYLSLGQINRMDFIFDDNIAVNDLPDNFMAYCNISAYVKQGTVVYQNPQTLMVEIPFSLRNAKLGTPGTVFANKINDATDSFLYKAQILGLANSILPKIQRICEIKNYFAMASFAGSLISTVGAAVSPVIGTGVQQGSMSFVVHIESLANCFYGDEKTQPQNNAVLQAQATDKTKGSQANLGIPVSSCPNLVRDTCDFLSCSVAEKYQQAGIGLLDTDSNHGNVQLTNIFSSDIIDKGILKNVDVPDVSNSLIMAAYTQCWPAVIYNLNKWRQIDCGYVYCLKETSSRGTDISVCDKVKSTQTCSLIVGEVFELPYVNIGKNIINNIGELINSVGPLAVVSLAKMGPCDKYLDMKAPPPVGADFDTTKIWVCQIPLQLARFVDGLKRSTMAAKFRYPEVQDMCELADKCAGNPYSTDPTCKNAPNMWTTLANIRIPDAQQDNRDYNYVKLQNDALKKTEDAETKLLSDLHKQADAGDTSAKADLDYYNKLTPQMADYTMTQVANPLIPMLTGIEVPADKNIISLISFDQQAKAYKTKADCGQLSCDQIVSVDATGKANVVKQGAMNPAEQQMKAQLDQKAFDDIKYYQDLLSKDSHIYDRPEYILAKNLALCQLGFCDTDSINGSCKFDTCKEVTKEMLATKEQDIKNTKAYNSATQAGAALNLALQMLYQNHVLDFMFSENWGGTAMKVVQFFNTDNWKNNLCNPDVSVLGGNDQDSGNIISCSTGNCIPILTMAAERQEFVTANNTHYYL